MIALVILLHCTSKLVEQCDTYQFSPPFYPGESCKEIYDWNPQTHNRSGYYWLINPPRHVYCDNEQRVVCGNIGGWTRIASVNITRGDECPTGWNKSSQDDISFCRSPSDIAGCYPVLFSSKEISYQKICGMARGYQKGTPDAFRSDHMDGLSITHGDPRQHIWSYVAGIHDGIESTNNGNCPCATNPGPQPTSFVGFEHYCESGINSGRFNVNTSYFSDPLWDGLDCPINSTCCDNPNLPWFYRELDMATMDDVEVRICTNQDFRDEAVFVDQLMVYVQ